MSRFNAKVRRFRWAAEVMSKGEREAMGEAMKAAEGLQRWQERKKMFRVVTDIGAARGRAEMKRASNRKTEKQRRKLIGARLPLKEAERCEACAEKMGISVYRFAVGALRRECERVEGERNI